MARTKKDKMWLAEKTWMYKQANFIMGFNVPIRDIPKGSKEIAFCKAESVKDVAIYLSNENYLTEGLSDSKKRALHIGAFSHELSHIQFTDFEYINTFKSTLSIGEAYIFNIIFNVLEDPAIENLAPTFIGTNMVKAMKYLIKLTYDKSPKLETEKTAFGQFLLAVIQYGDMGPLKGHFTFTDARDAFYRNIDDINEIIMNGDPQERVDISYRIFENVRPLWQDIADEYNEMAEKSAGGLGGMPGMPGMSGLGSSGEEEPGSEGEIPGLTTGSGGSGTSEGADGSLMELLEELIEATGTGISSGVTCGTDIDPEEVADSADLSKGARRNITVKKISEMDPEEKEAYEEGLKKKKEQIKKEKEENDAIIPEEGKAEAVYYNNSGTSDEETIVVTDDEIDLTTENDYDGEEYEIEKEALDSLERLIETEIELGTSETKVEVEIPNFESINGHYSSRMYKCINNMITVSDPIEAQYAYDRIVKKNINQINSSIKQLKALFIEDDEEEDYASHGKIDLEKAELSTTVTTKVFTKRKDPKDRSNMAVIIAIDESGSMSGSRIERAKETAICLVEMFGALGIPVYVMGYTADMQRADAYHNHYIFWNNKREERYRLTTITANANNFDGYSIRYASKLLGLRPELHKVMIVISDGQPACDAYYRYESGYRDTKDAIREARSNNQVVLGVGIGSDENILHEMYGLDFIFVERISDLFLNISKKFKSIVSKW